MTQQQDTIGLSAESKTAVSAELKKVLASSFGLYFKTHSFHWNVTGKHFAMYHGFFGEQYEALWEAVDDIAERIRMLGESAPRDFSELLHGSVVADSSGILNSEQMVAELLKGHSALLVLLRNAVSVAEKAGDAGNADFLTARIEYHEKAAWMLQSHLEG